MDGPTKLLRLYTDEGAYFGDRKVFEIIAMRAREAQMAGATVLTARLGFGRSAHLRSRHVLEDDQSVVVEIVDAEDRLRKFVADLVDVPDIGLITLEQIEVLNRTGG